jgi:TolA-binding protein
MHRLGPLVLLVLASWAGQSPAQASGDFACEASLQLVHRDLTGCDNMAMLSPGNDTRANLLLLMRDLRAAKGGTAPMVQPGQEEADALLDWPGFAAQFVRTPVAETDESPPPEPDASPDFAEGEGSRCRSNDAGAHAFEAALTADTTVPEAERTALIAARHALAPSCSGPSGGAEGIAAVLQQAQSPDAKSFAAYLQGAQAFYDGDYDTAKTQFAGLTGIAQPWLAVTAHYMLGRVEVNRAQINAFDEYGYPKETSAVDPKVVDAAEAGLQDYLKAYPHGQYAASANGLLRRVYWLGGRTDKLAASYGALLPEDPVARNLTDVDFAEEIDNKLLMHAPDAAVTDPQVLAVLDLLNMRGDKALSRAALEAQRPAFAADPALLDYLLAATAFYVENKPEEVTQMIPAADVPQRFTSLEFSRQMLRGMALEAQKDPKVREHWLAMLPASTQPLQRAAIELALAHHDERDNGLERVFAADSPVRNAGLRERLLLKTADAKLLRRQATDQTAPQHERDIALFTLLYKEVSRGRYADFVKDLALVPAGATAEGYPGYFWGTDPIPIGMFTQTTTLGDYGCGPLKETAARLAKTPKAPKAQLCLADFLRANGFDQTPLDTQPEAEEVGGTPSLFDGTPYVRQAVYQALIASAKTPAADKAYALYRAVNCYAPSGYNSCGGEEVPVAQRKAWFLKLKRDYPKSPWAKSLEYFW